jgi:hypothetical protein
MARTSAVSFLRSPLAHWDVTAYSPLLVVLGRQVNLPQSCPGVRGCAGSWMWIKVGQRGQVPKAGSSVPVVLYLRQWSFGAFIVSLCDYAQQG